MSVFTNYLEKLGSNFLVSAMIPSLALVVASILVFDPILNIADTFKDPQGTPQLISFGVIVFIFTVIIGFTLTALNTFILKLFEGYVTFFPVRFLYNRGRNIHLKKARELMYKRDMLESRIRQLEEYNTHILGQDMDLEALKAKHYEAAVTYNLNYPEALDDVLPTRFGNTLKAAENYPGERYGFDGVQLWPRLVKVIPEDYKTSIDNARNELSFLVNMSILSATFSSLCVLAFFYTMGTIPEVGSAPEVYGKFLEIAGPYMWAAALGFISFGFFYNASIFSVSSFGLMIRSSFDLFRLDLLKHFGLERPKDSIEEFDAWNKLNEMIVLGSHSLSYTKLDYRKEE